MVPDRVRDLRAGCRRWRPRPGRSRLWGACAGFELRSSNLAVNELIPSTPRTEVPFCVSESGEWPGILCSRSVSKYRRAAVIGESMAHTVVRSVDDCASCDVDLGGCHGVGPVGGHEYGDVGDVAERWSAIQHGGFCERVGVVISGRPGRQQPGNSDPVWALPARPRSRWR